MKESPSITLPPRLLWIVAGVSLAPWLAGVVMVLLIAGVVWWRVGG